MKFRTLILLLGIVFIYSCNKDNTNELDVLTQENPYQISERSDQNKKDELINTFVQEYSILTYKFYKKNLVEKIDIKERFETDEEAVQYTAYLEENLRNVNLYEETANLASKYEKLLMSFPEIAEYTEKDWQIAVENWQASASLDDIVGWRTNLECDPLSVWRDDFPNESGYNIAQEVCTSGNGGDCWADFEDTLEFELNIYASKIINCQGKALGLGLALISVSASTTFGLTAIPSLVIGGVGSVGYWQYCVRPVYANFDRICESYTETFEDCCHP